MLQNIGKKIPFFRPPKYLHSHLTGQYSAGRHASTHSNIKSSHEIKASIYWFGMYYLNEHVMKRKLQFKNKIPQSEVDKGYGLHFFFDQNRIKEEYYSLLNSTYCVYRNLQQKYSTFI